jgi:hypothetical protein
VLPEYVENKRENQACTVLFMVWEESMSVVLVSLSFFFLIMLINWQSLSTYILVCQTWWQVKNSVTLRLEINREITLFENENHIISVLTCLYYLFLCRELISQMNKQGYGNIFTVLFTLTNPMTIGYFHCP